ncbi:MAG TPA: GntR family transcriptional regulator [Gemmatimonadaceae bacterium]|nr:GntR family transcriptional regulator [Gemmatimonadaceae bacterium]
MLLYYSTSTVTLFLKPNPASGVPIYLQLKEQIRHACETGALRPGDSLPGMRALAESMVINPNTVARVYRELEQEGLLELRHGVGAFVASGGGTTRWTAARTGQMKAAQKAAKAFVHELRRRGMEPDEIRRLVEAELASHDGRVPLIG